MENNRRDSKTIAMNEKDAPLVPPPFTDNEVCEVDIEEAIEQSGSCGRWQVLLQIFFAYIIICQGMPYFLPYFILDDPAWVCTGNNRTANTTNEFCRRHVGERISPDSPYFQKRCEMNSSEWSYTTGKDYSIVTEYDLVCDKAHYADITSSMFFGGALLSGIFAGRCADIYGRKKVLIFLISCDIVSAIACSFAPLVWQLIALRLLYGLAVPIFNIGVIYLVEFVPPKHRALSGIVYQIPYSTSVLVLDGLGYMERRWRRLQLYVAVPLCLALLPIILLPESPRWLLAVGKKQESESVLNKVARCNGSSFVSHLEQPPTSSNNNKQAYSYIDMFQHKKVALITIAQALLWLTAAMLYYSLALESSKLGGNMYEVFALSVVAELPGAFVSLYFCNRFGRKNSVLCTLFLGASFTGAIAMIPRAYSEKHNILNITFALLAKFFDNIGYCCLFVWSLEINPTVVRSQALLFFNLCENIGGIVAPFLVGVLQDVSYILPFVVMSVATMSTCLLGLTLPETKGLSTREQFDDFFVTEVHDSGAVTDDIGVDNAMSKSESELGLSAV